MKVQGVEYDTWDWRYRVGERIRHEEVTYDIISRDAIEDDQGITHYFYTLRALDGVVRVVRNYIVNAESRRLGERGHGARQGQRSGSDLLQLRDKPDGRL